MQSQPTTIAFLGATGGVVNSVLIHTLRNGNHAIALARNPEKLKTQLESQGISPTTISTQLTIIPGTAIDPTAIKAVLTANHTPNFLVSHIVTGLGGAPTFYWNWRNPLNCVANDQPSLCGDAARVLVDALRDLYVAEPELRKKKPRLSFVSTTGISAGPEDVPVGLQTLYHGLLAGPHLDKREMERVFREGGDVFAGVVGVRPTLLTGGVAVEGGRGWENIRAGRMAEPARGWTVCRADVGEWIWVNLVGDEERRKEWEGDMVSLTN